MKCLQREFNCAREFRSYSIGDVGQKKSHPRGNMKMHCRGAGEKAERQVRQ